MGDYLLKNGVRGSLYMLIVVSKWSSNQVVSRVIQTLKDTNIWDPRCTEVNEALEMAYRDQRYGVCDLLVQGGVPLTMKNLPNLIYNVSFERIKKAIQNLKDTDSWDRKCGDASKALEKAYSYENYDVCDLLIQEGASLTMKNLLNMVYSVSFEYINKAIQNLKDTDNWDPKCDDASKALEQAYRYRKYDVCDLLIQEDVSLTMKNLSEMVYSVSFEYIKKAIQNMKDTKKWDPKCDDASMALRHAYSYGKYDVCNLLVSEISLTMKDLSHLVYQAPFESIKKAIQNMKDTDIWDPKCNDASNALENAYRHQKYDVYDTLVQEGIALPMDNLPYMVHSVSSEYIKKAIQNMKRAGSWDPKCDDASNALENSYSFWKYDVCDMLSQEGVSLKMKNLSNLTHRVSFEYIKEAVLNMKDMDNWDPKCNYAADALVNAYRYQKYDVCDFLLQEGVSLAMKNLPDMVYSASCESVKKAIQNMKDSDNWDPKCDDATRLLDIAYGCRAYDVCDLLIDEGISLAVTNLSDLVYSASFEHIKKAIQNMKDSGRWDSKCHDASKALKKSYSCNNYDLCDLLLQEGVSLTMKNLPGMVYSVPFEYIKKGIQNIKCTDSWDPKCDYASEALENAYRREMYDLCDLLVQGGVQLTMKNLFFVVGIASFEYERKTIQNLKDIDIWNPKSYYALGALEKAYKNKNHDVCDLLLQEGVSLTMKNLPDMVDSVSFEYIKKAIQCMKDTDSWDPKRHDASKALEKTYRNQQNDVCDLLVQEGISLRMKNLSDMVCSVPFEYIKKAIQNMKDTNNWDPKSSNAFEAFQTSYRYHRYEVCDLLVREEISLAMKNLPDLVCNVPLKTVKKLIQRLKETDQWDPKSDDASQALENAYIHQKLDVCDQLVEEKVSLTMKHLCNIACRVLFQYIKKAIQTVKNSGNWDPKCIDASEGLTNVYRRGMYDVCDLLVHEGVSLTMKNIPLLVGYSASLNSFQKALQHLQFTENWNPKCDDASEALKIAYMHNNYDVCDLLVSEGVSLTMKTLASVLGSKVLLKTVKKTIQNMKDTDNWDPKCDDANEVFLNALACKTYDVCDLLFEDGFTLRMDNLPAITGTFVVSYEDSDSYLEVEDEDLLSVENQFYEEDSESFEYIKKAIQNVKDNGNWDPKCDDASKSFENAYELQRYNVCDLLVQEGVFLTMKNLPYGVLCISFVNIREAIQNIKVSGNWDPKCDDASKALDNAYRYQKYNVCDLLVQEGVSLTMKNLPNVVLSIPIEYIKKAMQTMKDNDNWDPICLDASIAFSNAYRHDKYYVCDLFCQEGFAVTMKHLPDMVENVTFEYIRKTIQHLKDNGNWDPECDDASQTFENAYVLKCYDLCDLLVQDRVSLTMKNLPHLVESVSFEHIRTIIQNMKENYKWDPKCDHASEALENAYSRQMYDVCDLLDQEGVSLTMNNLPHVVRSVSFENIRKTIQNMKDNDNWNPNCDHACEALADATRYGQDDVYHLLVQEGISLTMNKLPSVVPSVPLGTFMKLVQHLKDTKNWDPKCDDASEALENANSYQRYDVCDLLVQEGVSLTMKKLPSVVYGLPFGTFLKLVQHLKDTKNWDPNCDDASEALENANRYQRYDVCDLLVQEGVLQTKQ